MVAFFIPAAQTVAAAEKQGSYRDDLVAGLRFFREDRLLLVIMVTIMVTNFLDAAKGGVILPVYANVVFDSAVALGLMFGLSGGGAVLGARVYGAVGHRFSRRWVFVGAFISLSLPSFVLAVLPPLWVVRLAQLLSGLGAGPIHPVLSPVEFERLPAKMRGGVFGPIPAGAWRAMPLGVLIGGYAVELSGLVTTIWVVGGLYLLTTVSLLFNPVLKDMDAPKVEGPLEVTV
jgi:MFS family permease